MFNRGMLEAFGNGRWKFLLPPATTIRGRRDELPAWLDAFGINFYSRLHLRFPGRKHTIGDFDYHDRSGHGLTDNGWEIAPHILGELIDEASLIQRPLVITENGLADATDRFRPDFLRMHFEEIRKAEAGDAARAASAGGQRVIFALVALVGVVITTIQALLVWRFRMQRRTGFSPSCVEFISILKPVCGLDDELEENLISFTRLRGIRYEVIISAEEWEDPALEVVRRVMRTHPFAPFRIVVDGGSRSGVVNRKVERLIAATREAKGDVFFISDSNVRVEPDDFARTLALFDDPRVGCVSNLFTGAGARSLGATIESLHLLSFVAPGAVLAASAKVPCVVGKSMALTRRVHDAIGGFEQFRRVLAEDQAIGVAVREAGYEVALSPVIASPFGRRPARTIERKSIFSISQISTAIATLICVPLPNSRRCSASTAPGKALPRRRPAAMQRATQSER